MTVVPKITTHPCERRGCDAPASVGLGATPMWLCPPHFDAELKKRLAAVHAAQALFNALTAET